MRPTLAASHVPGRSLVADDVRLHASSRRLSDARSAPKLASGTPQPANAGVISRSRNGWEEKEKRRVEKKEEEGGLWTFLLVCGPPEASGTSAGLPETSEAYGDLLGGEREKDGRRRRTRRRSDEAGAGEGGGWE